MYFLKLIRLNNLLIIALTQWIVRVFVIGKGQDFYIEVADSSIYWVIASTMLIAAAGYIINDYYDVKIDAINKPDQLIIDKHLKRRYALATNLVFNAIGIGLGLLVHWKFCVVYFACVFALWIYSNSLKRLPLIGNVVVAGVSAISIFMLALYYKTNVDLIIIFSVFAFVIQLIREVVKDMEDFKGDLTYGCKTLPIIWGIERTKTLVFALIVTLISSIIISLQILGHKEILFYQSILVIPILMTLSYFLMRAQKKKHFKQLSLYCKITILLGVLSLILA